MSRPSNPPCAAPPDIVLRNVKIAGFSMHRGICKYNEERCREKLFCIVLVLIGCCGECANGGDTRQIYSLHLSHRSL